MTAARNDSDDFDRAIVNEFRSNQGRVGGPLANTPILLLHHIGAKSQLERVTPLAYTRRSDGRYVIVASNAGSPTHPGWYHNLKAHPRVKIEAGTEAFWAHAEELNGPGRDAMWPELIAASPSLRDYQSKTRRQIPIVVLTRAARPARWPPAATVPLLDGLA